MTDLAAVLTELANTPTGQEQQAAEQAVTALLDAFGPGSAARLEAIALQAKAMERLRVADRQEYHARFAAVVAAAEQERETAQAEADALTEATTGTLAALRAAQDKQQAAADYHRKAAEAVDDAAMIGDSPAARVELILARDAAKQVLDQFADALARADRTHTQALADAEAAWKHLQVAKQAGAAAKTALADAEDRPELAPRSSYTLLLGMSDAVKDYASLTTAEQATLRGLVGSISTTIGADAPAVERGRQQGLTEGRAEARRAISTMPPRGSQVIQAPRM